jgi:hypothetical protein
VNKDPFPVVVLNPEKGEKPYLSFFGGLLFGDFSPFLPLFFTWGPYSYGLSVGAVAAGCLPSLVSLASLATSFTSCASYELASRAS